MVEEKESNGVSINVPNRYFILDFSCLGNIPFIKMVENKAEKIHSKRSKKCRLKKIFQYVCCLPRNTIT